MTDVVAAAALGGVALVLIGTLIGAARRLAMSLAVQAVGMALLGIAGGALVASGDRVGAGFKDSFGLALGLDPLSGFFLAALALVAVPALVFARGYLEGRSAGPVVAALTGLFLLALVDVLAARDVSAFLAGWELMTLLPAAAILVLRHDAAVVRSTYIYLAITHIGGAGVWVAMLTLAHHGAFTDPSALSGAGGVQAFVGLSALVGFGTKAGVMPFHTWLPRAHPVAPSHISALMSGMMIKVALYGLIRVLFGWLGGTPTWLALVVLALGLLSSLGGVLYALVQHDLKRLLAFHSIENVGIIMLGLGASLLFSSYGHPVWAAIAFAAALLHTLNHAVFKALLFLAAGAFERAVGSLELDRLGGLLKRMPWTGASFLIGAMAISGVPPLNGFVSEWLTLQSLLHLSIGGSVGVAVAAAIATAGLAATAALAVFCFVKAVGLVLLGAPRRAETAQAEEVGWSMRAGPAFLAACCIALGAVPGLLLPSLLKLAPVPQAAAADVVLRIPGTGSLPALWLMLGLVVFTALIWVARGRRRTASAPAWTCGQRIEPALNWTSAGFTKPLRLILEVVLRPRREVIVTNERGLLRSVRYSGEVPHLFDTLLYEPVQRRALAIAAVARRLQSGSVRTYAAYLLALVLLALVLARVGVLG